MISSIIKKPVITEYSLKDAGRGVYTFVVSNGANKSDVKKAIEKQFSVQVTKVATTIIKDTKNVRTRTAVKSKKASYKKARVTLVKGQKISVFEEKAK